jgi:hypothetical protein
MFPIRPMSFRLNWAVGGLLTLDLRGVVAVVVVVELSVVLAFGVLERVLEAGFWVVPVVVAVAVDGPVALADEVEGPAWTCGEATGGVSKTGSSVSQLGSLRTRIRPEFASSLCASRLAATFVKYDSRTSTPAALFSGHSGRQWAAALSHPRRQRRPSTCDPRDQTGGS